MKTTKPSSNHRFSNVLTVSAGVLAAIALASHTQAQQAPAPQQQQSQQQQGTPPANAQPATPQQGGEGAAQIQNQLEAVNQKLLVAQQAAMTEPDVQKEQIAYEQTLTHLIVKEDPPLETAVEQQKALVNELQGSPEFQKPAEERNQDFQAKLEEYQKVEQTLAPKRAQAAASPEAQEQRGKVQKVLVEAMTEVEPATPELLEQRNALMAQLQQGQR